MAKKFIISLICIFLINGTALAEYKTDFFKMGKYQYKVSNYIGCIESMQKVVASDPKNAMAHYYFGMSYTQLAQKDKAKNEYSLVITLSPLLPIAYYAKTGMDNLTPQQNIQTSSIPMNLPAIPTIGVPQKSFTTA